MALKRLLWSFIINPCICVVILIVMLRYDAYDATNQFVAVKLVLYTMGIMGIGSEPMTNRVREP